MITKLRLAGASILLILTWSVHNDIQAQSLPSTVVAGRVSPSTQSRDKASREPRERSRWVIRSLLGAVANTADGPLRSKPSGALEGVGNLTVTSKGAAGYEFDVSYDIARSIIVRAAYQMANVDFGTDYFTENINAFNLQSMSIATARVHMPKVGAFYAIRTPSGKGSLNVGVLAGPAYYTGIKVTGSARERMGVQEVTGRRGFPFGGELEYQHNLGHSGVVLGVNIRRMFGRGAELNIQTAANSNYESGSVQLLPVVFGATLGYRFR